MDLESVKIGLMRSAPFWAVGVFGAKHIPTTEVITMATDGEHFYYNPNWLANVTASEAEFVEAHEKMHIDFKDHLRRNGRDFKLWNIATDHRINLFLKSCGFKVPDNRPCDPRFLNMTAEKIYNILQSEQKNQGKKQSQQQQGQGQNQQSQGQGQGQQDKNSGSYDPHAQGQEPCIDEVLDFKGKNGSAPSEGEVLEEEMRIKTSMEQAMQIARKAGKLSGALEAVVKNEIAPKVDWVEALASWLNTIRRDNYTWARANRRYSATMGLYLPSLYNKTLDRITVIIDTSGSVWYRPELVKTFVAEVFSVVRAFDIQEMLVIYVDTKVQGTQVIANGDDELLELPGGGGTSFKPGFKYIEEQEIETVGTIYLTDGECNDFGEEPEHPVVWAVSKEFSGFKPTWGDVVTVG